jgi:3-phosphoshikimate 1-carboxyvinyltransferase
LWEAPLATGPLDATVDIPGSKSLNSRFLVLAAIASGPVTIRGALRSRDSSLMIEALRTFGVQVDDSGEDWTVTPPERLTGGGFIECGLAGTVMRFVPPLMLLADAPVNFDGDLAARARPMGPMIDALRALGAGVDDAGTGALPFTVTPPTDVAPEVAIDASASSQFVSGLLLVAARLPSGLTIRHTGATLPSLPHIDMTCQTLRGAGITVLQPDERTWTVLPGQIHLGTVRVEPDLSNAGPFIAAALVAGGTVRIPHWPAETTQPGALYPELLRKMGATCTLADGVMAVTGTGAIHGIDADLSQAGEITPTIAALCAIADGPSNLMGIGHLRGHETDRLAALAAEIKRIGGRCDEGAASLHIRPPADGPLHGAEIQTYHDHRMATFGAIVGLRVPGTHVINVGTTAKTMPEFPTMWRDMLAQTAAATTGHAASTAADSGHVASAAGLPDPAAT